MLELNNASSQEYKDNLANDSCLSFQVIKIGVLDSNPVRLQALVPGAAVDEHRAAVDSGKDILVAVVTTLRNLWSLLQGPLF